MQNEQDVRYLLIDEFWPEYYEDLDLFTQADLIFQEKDKLFGDDSYLRGIKNAGNDQNEDNKILFLVGILKLANTIETMKYKLSLLAPYANEEELIQIADFYKKDEIVFDILKEVNSKYKTLEEVEKAMKNRIFDSEVEQDKKQSEKLNKKQITFEELCIPIEQYFKKDLDYNITVAKFAAWQNRMKESIKKAS